MQYFTPEQIEEIRRIALEIEQQGMKEHEKKVTQSGYCLGILWLGICAIVVYFVEVL